MKKPRTIQVRAEGVIVQLEDNKEAWLSWRELSTQYNPLILLKNRIMEKW